MKKFRLVVALLCFAAASLYATSEQAQTARPQMVAVGSSAQFPTFGIAAVTPDPIITGSTAPCGTNIWTGGTSLAFGVDARSAQISTINAEPGNIFVVYDGTVNTTTGAVTGNTTVCVYLSVDSIVGQRLFFGQGINTATSQQTNGYISLSSAAETTAGAGKVSFVKDGPDTCPSAGTWGAAGTAICPLPASIYNIVNGANFNVALTDVRAEDGIFATTRAECSPSDSAKLCLGYNEGLYAAGTFPAVYSVFSSSIANVVPYSIPPGSVQGSTLQGNTYISNGITLTAGVDPLWTNGGTLTIPAANTISVGAAPVLVIVNKADTQTGALGFATNIKSDVLSQIYSGWVGQVAAVTNGTILNGAYAGPFVPLWAIQREPISGTYNTFEWQTVRSGGVPYENSQELNTPAPSISNFGCGIAQATGINPEISCQNPLDYSTGIDGGHSWRMRAIGTGDVVNNLNTPSTCTTTGAVCDTIGYAFWSLGTFGGKTNIKYLTVDGVDPLYASYSTENGLFPTSVQCTGFFNLGTFGCSGWTLPSFPNILNGNYRIWSIYRAIVDTTVQPYQMTTLTGTTTPALLIQAAQDQASTVSPDFVPFQACANSTCSSTTQILQVFRSHYGRSGVYPNNGILQNHWYNFSSPSPQSAPYPALPGEGGGDMAGQSYPWATELDYVNYAGQFGEFLADFE